MLHVPGMPEGVHVSFSPEHLPVSSPAQPERYTSTALVGAGTPSKELTVLLDAHELAYGHTLCSEAYGLPDVAERRQAEEAAFRALLHTPMQSDADRVAYAIAVISRQMHSLGDGSATERDHPMAVAYRNLRFGEHAREPEEMRHVGRVAEPEPAATVDREALALVDALERDWAAEIVGDREDRSDLSAEADARSDARTERRYALLDAAEALPAGSREARHAKALAFAWDASIMLWQADRTRDQYGTDGRLMLDLMDSLTGGASAPAPSLTFAPATPTAADPHVALLPALRQAFAWTRDAQPFCDEPSNSTEGRAHTAVFQHCWRLADRIVALPAPATLAGMGTLALALCVGSEGFIGLPQNDGFDHERYPEERRIAVAVRAMMSASGVSPLAEWSGFGDEPDHGERWDAMLERVGEGSLPAWAFTCKSEPDTDDLPEESATLIGSPPAVAEPATALLTRYVGWLGREFGEAHDELLRLNPTLMEPRNSWSAPRTPIGGLYMCHEFADPVTSAVVDAAPASTRAALVLSAVGCDWRQA